MGPLRGVIEAADMVGQFTLCPMIRKAGNQEPSSLLFSHDVCPSRILDFDRPNQPYEPRVQTPTEPYVSLISLF